MSKSSTPQPQNGYASPSPHSSTNVSRASSTKPVQKPGNVFSNDGSFLERVQRSKKEEEEKKKQEEALARKRNFDARFRNRGKRPPPDPTPAPDPSDEDHPNKKLRADKSLTEYEKQMQNFSGRTLKDDGMGVRPLVK